jgi:branched-chain amino acid transport system ATP-binding protein
VLKIREIDVYYGAIHALKNLSLEVAEGSIVTLIGANGAGKTTTLKSISGILRPSSGSILFKGQELLKMAPEKIVALGISQVPEGRRVFQEMSVLENLEMGGIRTRERAINPLLDFQSSAFSHTQPPLHRLFNCIYA